MESNAILSYLADGSELFRGNAFDRATILSWLFFEQYSHEPFIATSRFIVQYLGRPADRESDLEQKKAGGEKALRILDAELANRPYLAGDEFTIADIALFAYTHVAEEGDFSLEPYPAVRAWIERIKGRPNFVSMS